MPVRTEYKDWSKAILYKNTRAGNTTLPYLAIGWGDKGFYLNTPTWADLKFSTAFKAAFGLSKPAMHATFYRDPSIQTPPAGSKQKGRLPKEPAGGPKAVCFAL